MHRTRGELRTGTRHARARARLVAPPRRARVQDLARPRSGLTETYEARRCRYLNAQIGYGLRRKLRAGCGQRRSWGRWIAVATRTTKKPAAKTTQTKTVDDYIAAAPKDN